MTETKQTTLHSHNEYVAAKQVLESLKQKIDTTAGTWSDLNDHNFYCEIITNYEKQHGK